MSDQSPVATTQNARRNPVAALGAYGWTVFGELVEAIAAFGRFTRFSGATLAGLRSVRTWSRHDRFRRQLFFIGTMSVPVLGITGAFIGMILAIEGYLQFAS